MLFPQQKKRNKKGLLLKPVQKSLGISMPLNHNLNLKDYSEYYSVLLQFTSIVVLCWGRHI